MTITRADTLSNNLKKQEFFSDFLDSFSLTPLGNDIGRVINERSVTQSIKNLIFTNLGERLFQPNIGSNVSSSLFEMNDSITSKSIILNIQNTIKYNEPRCNLISVNVNSINEYGIAVVIVYSLINNPAPITINMMLQRIR